MEIEKNDITSADSAEEEIVFSTGKKDTPAQSNNEPEVSNNYGSEPQADSTVSFGSALTSAAEDEAEGVVAVLEPGGDLLLGGEARLVLLPGADRRALLLARRRQDAEPGGEVGRGGSGEHGGTDQKGSSS